MTCVYVRLDVCLDKPLEILLWNFHKHNVAHVSASIRHYCLLSPYMSITWHHHAIIKLKIYKQA